MQSPPRRSSTTRIVVIVIGVVAGCLTLLLLAGVGGVLWMNRYRDTEIGRCKEFMGIDCTSVRPEAITRITGMALPDGTVVESSDYHRFQDWMLRAVFIVPAAGVAEWERSLADYPPAQRSGCTGLEGRGAGRTCTAPSDPSANPVRSYTRANQPDGSVVVLVRVFTT